MIDEGPALSTSWAFFILVFFKDWITEHFSSRPNYPYLVVSYIIPCYAKS